MKTLTETLKLALLMAAFCFSLFGVVAFITGENTATGSSIEL